LATNRSSCPPSGGSGEDAAAPTRTLTEMSLQPHDTDTHLIDPSDLAPVTGEYRLRPPVTLEAEPAEGVPVWEPEVGDYA
jgi:hypothetical protein